MSNDPADKNQQPPQEPVQQPRWRSAWNEALEASQRAPDDAAGAQRAHEAFAPPDDHANDASVPDASGGDDPQRGTEGRRGDGREPDGGSVVAAPVGAPLFAAEPVRAPSTDAFAPPVDDTSGGDDPQRGTEGHRGNGGAADGESVGAAPAGAPLSTAAPERAAVTEAFTPPDDHPVGDAPILPMSHGAADSSAEAAPVGAPLSTAEPSRVPATDAFTTPDDHPIGASIAPVASPVEPTAAYAADAMGAPTDSATPAEPAARWSALASTDRLRELYRSPATGGVPPRAVSPAPTGTSATPVDDVSDDEDDVVMFGGGARVTYVDAFERDRYGDVPASLELGYSAADIGLSPRAYDRAIPYETIERQRQRHSSTRVRRVGRELVETVILALLIFFAVKAVVQNFRVEGSSMEPSMHNNQYLLVNKALYFRVNLDKVHDYLPFIPGDNGQERHVFRPPRRGDVIVFRFPLDPSRDFIKRVIGVPGDTIEVKDETVFVNGSPLKEDYIQDKPNYTYAAKTVPPGMYYVLGDNRRNSYDSHAWGTSCTPQQQCDFVPEENIIGQAWVSYWPWADLGLINNKTIRPQAP